MITFTKVDSLPKRGNNRLQKLIEEFVNDDAKIVKLNYAEKDYASPSVCRSTLAIAVMRSGHKSVKVRLRGKDVYLIKTE